MNYQQTLDYLFSQLPMFHRIGAAAYKANLDNTIEIGRITGNPHKNFPSVHIAGTNGKGSVSNMLASVLQESGYKTALFTSPHLVDFRERIRINGKMIPEQFICDFVEQYREDFERIQPSFFEMTFGLAMSWFSKEKVEIAVIETGMGGRLDSTNVIMPMISVITNIALDHTQFLGTTIASIAKEKAGIIKPCIPVIIGETDPQSADVFKSVALENKSSISFADKEITLSPDLSNSDPYYLRINAKSDKRAFTLDCPLTGIYQLKNLATVIETAIRLEVILGKPESLCIGKGIKNTLTNTGFKGRWQTLREKPLTICDIGHNPHGIQMVVTQLESMQYKNLHFVIGVVNDKDISAMLSLLPENARYYFCKADIPRGLDASQLQAVALTYNLRGDVYSSVKEALNSAWETAGGDDLVFIGGSAFTVAEVV